MRVGSNNVEFKVPILPAGIYTLLLKTKSSGGQIRVAEFEQPLTLR